LLKNFLNWWRIWKDGPPKIDGAIKVFHDKQKLKQYVTTKPPLQNILQGILHTESDTQLNHEKAGSTKPQDKKKQDSRE
jgi:hypothetical protein